MDIFDEYFPTFNFEGQPSVSRDKLYHWLEQGLLKLQFDQIINSDLFFSLQGNLIHDFSNFQPEKENIDVESASQFLTSKYKFIIRNIIKH